MRIRVRLMLSPLVLSAACGGGGGGEPTQPNNPNNPNNPNQPTTVPVTVVINSITRDVVTGVGSYEVAAATTPTGVEVKYYVASSAVPRSAAPPYSSLFACFGDLNANCVINVNVGQTLNLYAIEGQGSWAGDRGPGRPVPAVLPIQHEFVGFGGDCPNSTANLGTCSLTIQAGRTYSIRADFAPMPTAIFNLHGAGDLQYDFNVRDQLHIPNRPYVHPSPTCCAGGLYPQSSPLVFMHMPTGSTITATRRARPMSQFLRWTGACTGNGASCTIPVGTPASTATAVFEYWDCGTLGLSDGGTGPSPPQGCQKISPRIRGVTPQTR